MKKVLICGIAAIIILLRISGASAQSMRGFSNLQVHYNFGDQVVFQSTLDETTGIENIFLFLEQSGEDTLVRPAEISPNGIVETILDLKQYPLRPYATVSYYFRLKTVNGDSYESERGSFEYVDNRFRWDLLEDKSFQVYWYGRDVTFGQSILNVAHAGLESAQRYINAPLPMPLKIYVYENATDLQFALALSQQNAWVAGHASPDLNTILVSIPSDPQQQLELERQIPHEIAHILQFSLVGEKYALLPVWLLEGSASLAELYPNPDYPRAIVDAVQSEGILAYDSLCITFPRDASGAFLAYAQSESFIRYIYQNYGTSGLTKLFEVYADGLGCEEGAHAALGIGLNELDFRWQQSSLGINSGWLAARNLSPYFLLLVVLLVPPLAVGLFKRR
jgi:hypothetical protein